MTSQMTSPTPVSRARRARSPLALAPLALAAAAIFVGAGAALAQNDPIAQRKALMKAVGDSTRAPAAMLKGEQPFDLVPVQAALRAMQAAGKQMPGLFPDDTKTGGDTAAAAKIWENKADFNAKWAKFEADSTAALARVTDDASFKASYPDIVRSCGGCHQDYRVRR